MWSSSSVGVLSSLLTPATVLATSFTESPTEKPSSALVEALVPWPAHKSCILLPLSAREFHPGHVRVGDRPAVLVAFVNAGEGGREVDHKAREEDRAEKATLGDAEPHRDSLRGDAVGPEVQLLAHQVRGEPRWKRWRWKHCENRVTY